MILITKRWKKLKFIQKWTIVYIAFFYCRDWAKMTYTRRKNRWIKVRLTCGHETDTGIQREWSTEVWCPDCKMPKHVSAAWENARVKCLTCKYSGNRIGWDGLHRGQRAMTRHGDSRPGHTVQLWHKGELISVYSAARVQPELALEWPDDPPPF